MLHAEISLYIDGDDKVNYNQLEEIGGTGIGDSDFDSWKVIFNCRTQDELTGALKRILELLTK